MMQILLAFDLVQLARELAESYHQFDAAEYWFQPLQAAIDTVANML